MTKETKKGSFVLGDSVSITKRLMHGIESFCRRSSERIIAPVIVGAQSVASVSAYIVHGKEASWKLIIVSTWSSRCVLRQISTTRKVDRP